MTHDEINKEAAKFFPPQRYPFGLAFSQDDVVNFAKHCVDKATAWRPIEEAPKDGSSVMVFGLNYGDKKHGTHQCFARWEDDKWVETNEWNLESELTYLTHWQPLPPAPEAA